jgi:hypothetical protein
MSDSKRDAARTAAMAVVGLGFAVGGVGLWRVADALGRLAPIATEGGAQVAVESARDGVARTSLATDAMAAVGGAALAAALPAAQAGEPTIVWYGTYGGMYGSFVGGALLRAWSDGTVEMKKIATFGTSSGEACGLSTPCTSQWFVISSPTVGYRAHADLDADESVGGADLAILLSSWGDAPRVAVPESTCPLDLVVP